MRANWGNQPNESVLDRIADSAPGLGTAQAGDALEESAWGGMASFGRRVVQWLRGYALLIALSWGEVEHWLRSGLRRTEIPTRRALQTLIVTTLLGGLIVSSVGSVAAVVSDYTYIHDLESQGLTALKSVPDDLGLTSTTAQTHRITSSQIAKARADINTADRDFQRLQSRLANPDPVLSLAGQLPKISSLLQSAYLLSGVAIDVTLIAQQMLGSLVVVADVLEASPLLGNTSSTTGLTASDLQHIQSSLNTSLPYVDDLITRIQAQPASELLAALSDKQQAEVTSVLSVVSQIPAYMPVIDQFLQVAPTILGVTKPTAYLLVAMDSTEMRPSGGFQGNDAVVGVSSGRIGSISLQDVYLLDKPYNAAYPGDVATPPSEYAGWWPTSFLPWGLRDANLSASFPTSAQDDLRQLQAEGGDAVPIVNSSGVVTGSQPTQVGGVIAIEPAIIEQMLNLTGPITIGAPYNATVTAGNVEQEIHYFQLTNQGRALGGGATGGDALSSKNKRFTALLARSLQAKLKMLPKTTLLQLLPALLHDLHTKDIQIYFSDPAAENFLRDYQTSSEMYTGTQDALMIDDANISGNKASQYLTEFVTDSIKLDAAGGATHTMTIIYHWEPPPILNGMDPNQVYSVLYNADTSDDFGLFYREYVRVYTAPNPLVISSSGWQFTGIETVLSDFPARGMIGAHYLLNGDATQQPVAWNVPTVTLVWHVNNVFTPGSSYNLHVQRQAGDLVHYAVTITPPSCDAKTLPQSSEISITTDQVVSFFIPAC